MKSYYWGIPGLIACIGFICVILAPQGVHAATCEQWVAEITSVQGEVEVQKAGEKQWQSVSLHDRYCPGDKIRVLDRSRADLALVDQPMLRLDQNTTIALGGLKKEGSLLAGLFQGAAQLDLIKGAAHFFSRLPRNLEVRTAFVNAGVEGTEFFIKVEEDKTFISVFEGKVLASNKAGTLPITSGQSAEAQKGKAPVYRAVVHPRDAVRWALYYPPVIDTSTQVNLIQEGRQDPKALTLRASQLLSVGRVDEASADIENALVLDPQCSTAFALQSIIAVVQNEKEKALVLAGKAIEADPQSATAQISLSYAKQADFDLKGAKKSVEKAVELDSENALAWARLSELWSSFGELDKALKAAQKAVALNPNLSRTQTVLGFVYLTQIKTTKAKDAFSKAIELDQADPLPRLGLGLTKIREGRLHEGRREIEIAASLDSSNALVRSYLGKSYYEEKRKKLAEQELDIAKGLDPLDPTPWFYGAIEKQTSNQPVEALHGLEKAMALNDNRAVYRSKLMLDSDQAARSASLARIYTDLGFQQLALDEGYNSVNTDPTNYSAHRFLADSYSILPRHEIARVSELLQSQLLQPNNITPIQPQLAESNLFLISSGGAAETSFNEFNPLFYRDQVALQASGLFGSNSTSGGEAVASGIYKKASYSAGYSNFKTDGFRRNNDQDDDIANAFFQLELTPQTSIQTEYRYRDIETGDVQLRFFKDDFRPNFRETKETNTIRLGFRHAFSPGSKLIGNFTYQDLQEAEHDAPAPIVTIDGKADQHAYGGELSYLHRSPRLNLVGGLGYFDITGTDKINTVIDDIEVPLPPPFPPQIIPGSTELLEADKDATHTNLYLYSYMNLLENLTVTVAGSGDFFNASSEKTKDKDQFNPKVGITWQPLPGTTLRAAAFRVLRRTLVTDQTIEPTQVAGFGQFFDDINTTSSWRYGVAVDQKFSKNINGGLEYSERDLKVPYFDAILDALRTVDWSESLSRAYLFWTPHNWLALSAEYLREDFTRDRDFANGAKNVKTVSVPLGIKFFHPSGLTVSLKGTYTDQEGSFERVTAVQTFENGADNFWLVDAALSYRLPKRYGFIAVGAKNLFDKEFQYFDTDQDNPRIIPDSFFFARLTLAIP